MSDKLMKGLFPTVNVKKTTVAACKASGDNKSKCNSLTFHDLENREDYLSKNESQKAKVACVWEKESCTSKEKCCTWHPGEPIEGKERGVKGCGICGYTGEISTGLLQTKTKSGVRAKVLDNKISAFISSVRDCNELFPDVVSQKIYDAKLASYTEENYDHWEKKRKLIIRRDQYIGCIMHCFRNLEADQVKIDDVKLSIAGLLLESHISTPDFTMILKKYRDDKKTDETGEIDETQRQKYLRTYNEAIEYESLTKPARYFDDGHVQDQYKRNIAENREILMRMAAEGNRANRYDKKGGRARATKYSRRGKRRRTKRKKKSKKRRKSMRKKKRKTKKRRMKGG